VVLWGFLGVEFNTQFYAQEWVEGRFEGSISHSPLKYKQGGQIPTTFHAKIEEKEEEINAQD
jgi:hypothetical protein